jgi:hypothetical protein
LGIGKISDNQEPPVLIREKYVSACYFSIDTENAGIVKAHARRVFHADESRAVSVIKRHEA